MVTRASNAKTGDSSGGNFQMGINPGIMIRIEQASLDNWWMALQKFFPHYFQFDLDIPRNIEFDIGFGDILWGIFTRHVSWSDIIYENPILDIMNIKV